MKQALAWIKDYIITFISAVAVVIALSFLVWLWFQGSGFREELKEREKKVRQLELYMQKSMTIPAKDPDEPAEVVRGVTVNPVSIKALETLYGQLNGEYEQIFSLAIEVNQGSHIPLVAGLFPKPEDVAKPFRAREEYRATFPKMMAAPSEDAAVPQINAGMPPTQDEIAQALTELETEYIASLRTPGTRAADLTPEDQEKLLEDKKAKLLDLLQERARSINIYAVTDMRSEQFPLQVGEWSRSSNPDITDIWQGQFDLWIQQDILEAIARANRVREDKSSVVDAPVKRLLDLEVIEGYVGINTRGGMTASKGSQAKKLNLAGPQDMMGADPFGMDPFGMGPGMGGPMGGSPGSTDTAPVVVATDPNQPLPVNYKLSPTGRISNGLYDVRHVRLSLVVDYLKIDDLFDAISRTNLMTILSCEVKDIDEYEALREGFVYGEGDAAQVDLVIETIWLRAWTKQYMPNAVRGALGIPVPEEDEAEQSVSAGF